MEAKFTKGKWSVDPNHRSDIQAESGKDIAVCLAVGVEYKIPATAAVEATVAEAEANARLIAAAPEMFLALERIYDYRDSEYVPNALFSVIKATLARAKGEAA